MGSYCAFLGYDWCDSLEAIASWCDCFVPKGSRGKWDGCSRNLWDSKPVRIESSNCSKGSKSSNC